MPVFSSVLPSVTNYQIVNNLKESNTIRNRRKLKKKSSKQDDWNSESYFIYMSVNKVIYVISVFLG